MRYLVPIILLVTALALGTWLGFKEPTVSLGPAVCIEFMNVGQGDCVLIRTPEGATALVDAGGPSCGEGIVDYLRRLGIKRLDLVVMTHPERDHLGGMPDVLKAFPVYGVLDSGYLGDSDLHRKVLKTIEDQNIPYHRAVRGMEFRLDSQARLEVLAPSEQQLHGTVSDSANNSVVVRLVYGRVRVLLPGDIRREGEASLIASHVDIESEVLKVAYHGKADSTSLEFLRLVRPQYCIISAKAGEPDKSTLSRLATEHTGASLFRTDRNGTITVRTDGQKIVVEAER